MYKCLLITSVLNAATTVQELGSRCYWLQIIGLSEGNISPWHRGITRCQCNRVSFSPICVDSNYYKYWGGLIILEPVLDLIFKSEVNFIMRYLEKALNLEKESFGVCCSFLFPLMFIMWGSLRGAFERLLNPSLIPQNKTCHEIGKTEVFQKLQAGLGKWSNQVVHRCQQIGPVKHFDAIK